jgi:predicted nucleic acid-binding Zn ribbon protein
MSADIDFDRVEYATNRKLPNDDGELTGHIKMYSYDDVNFTYTMTCPHCGTEQEGEKEMPNRPYYIKCEECGENNLVRKMKGQGSKVKRPTGEEVGSDDDADQV